MGQVRHSNAGKCPEGVTITLEVFVYSIFLFFFSLYSSLYNFQSCKEERVIKQPKNRLFQFQNYLVTLTCLGYDSRVIYSNSRFRVFNLHQISSHRNLSNLTIILRRSRTGTVWFYTSTSNKRAARPKLYTKSLTGDLKRMYCRFTLVRISINLQAPCVLYIGTGVSLLFRERFLYI